jgi:sugar phosphate isomerase/epimerase
VFRLAYNTNGLAHHRAVDALRLVAALGYEGLALTPDVGQLDPYRLDPREVREVRVVAEELGLALALETGARFVLDAEQKHAPSLCDEGSGARQRRVDFYRRCIDLAVDLGAPLVSLWAGAAPGGVTLDGLDLDRESGRDRDTERTATTERVLDRLGDGLALVCAHGAAAAVTVAFEPEPGMFVERPRGYTILRDRLRSLGHALPLTLDVGHCVVTGDLPVREVVSALRADLAHVHLADCPRGVHEHRALGEGDLDLADALGGLQAVGFGGLVAVELSRDSHRGPAAARQALAVVRQFTAIS